MKNRFVSISRLEFFNDPPSLSVHSHVLLGLTRHANVIYCLLEPRHSSGQHSARAPRALSASRAKGASSGRGSLEEITNQIFEDLMRGKSQMAHGFDELGILELEKSKVDVHVLMGVVVPCSCDGLLFF